MNIYKGFLSGIFLALLLALSGCQGNNSESPTDQLVADENVMAIDNNTTLSPIDVNTTVVSVLLPVSSKTLTVSSEDVQIEVSVFDSENLPYSEGFVKLKYPDDVLSGRDIGSFDKLSSTLANGKAYFNYTAPIKLDANTSDISFGFYHDSTPTNMKAYTFSIVPETNQTVSNNYVLYSSLNSENVSMELNSEKSVEFYLTDDNNITLENNAITSMKFESKNPALLTLSDVLSDTNGSTITIEGRNSVTVKARSNTLSGIIPIKVTVIFTNSNGTKETLEKVFNIVVLSGPPTAMSLSYAGTEQNANYAKFIENWVLTVTDKYNNPINTTPAVAMGLIVGYAESSATTSNVANYLYFNSVTSDGNLTNSALDTFKSSKEVFENVDLVNDKLVLFGGTGYLFDAYGKWDINAIESNTTLSLKDDYNGSDVSGLGFAVGHNFRNETCSGSPVVANVYAQNNNNILESTGSMILQIEYDYYLVGKSVMLWTNILGQTNNVESKLGLARKVTLRGTGLTGGIYAFSKGFSGPVRLDITISDTVEYYKNANFGYAVEVTGNDINWTVLGDSMRDGNITALFCDENGGMGYVDVNITSPAGTAGEIKIVNVLVGQEF
ncbi:MAG: hypothetical protein AUK54_05960 [Helicobacteraceae bacterium CG2_30_36_10]|nr:MAG: hypothetical protein AUK54_05960 [Helicobacteraceae bacterium CG2_30_36_10]